MYKFLVAYAHAGGFGRRVITWGQVFESDVYAIERHIEDDGAAQDVVVLNIQPLPIVPGN